MTLRLVILVSFAFVSTMATAEEAYRWEDEEGRIHYSDELPPPGARNVQRTHLDSGELEQVLPYRLRLAVDQSPVTLYVTDCGPGCDMARELLLGRGVPHTLLDANLPEVQEALKTLTEGQLEVPVAEVGTTVLRGFEEGQWNAALDAAGYPGYAMIEVTPYVPQPAEQPDGQADENGAPGASDDGELDTAEVEAGELESDESLVEDFDTDELANEDAESADIGQDE